jgi:hypothetical protein
MDFLELIAARSNAAADPMIAGAVADHSGGMDRSCVCS